MENLVERGVMQCPNCEQWILETDLCPHCGEGVLWEKQGIIESVSGTLPGDAALIRLLDGRCICITKFVEDESLNEHRISKDVRLFSVTVQVLVAAEDEGQARFIIQQELAEVNHDRRPGDVAQVTADEVKAIMETKDYRVKR